MRSKRPPPLKFVIFKTIKEVSPILILGYNAALYALLVLYFEKKLELEILRARIEFKEQTNIVEIPVSTISFGSTLEIIVGVVIVSLSIVALYYVFRVDPTPITVLSPDHGLVTSSEIVVSEPLGLFRPCVEMDPATAAAFDFLGSL